jgi:hypothetical protein
MKITNYLIILSISLSIGLVQSSCKKNEEALTNKNSTFLNNNKSTNIFGNLVSFNSAYNVLEFDEFSDVRLLTDALLQYEDNFPYSRGNESDISQTLLDVIEFGWTNGNNPKNGQIKISDFIDLLEDSYPLNESNLEEIISTSNQVSTSFSSQLVRPILIQNAPLSLNIRNQVTSSSMPNGIKNQILNASEAKSLIPNLAFEDFLNEMNGFNSLYTSLEANAEQQLNSGMDPSDQLYDNDFIRFDAERILLNSNREIFVRNNLFKIYDDCRIGIFQGSISEAYASLNLVGPGGNIVTPIIPETNAGLTIAEMNSYVPMNFALISIDQIPYTEKPVRDENPINLENINSFLYDPNCPQSSFNFTRDNSNDKLIYFNSYTDLNYNGGTFYQYWNFGDGTGSFITDPTHQYSTDGAYEVSVTTFNSDCGCWDVEKIIILVGDFDKACNIDVYGTATVQSMNPDYLYSFTINVSNASSNSIQSIDVDYGDGTTESFTGSTSLTFTHTYAVNPGTASITNFIPEVTVTMSDGCSSLEIPFGSIGAVFPDLDCCDRKDKTKEKLELTFGSSNYQLKMKDRVTGSVVWLFFGTKIVGDQTFYRKKSNGNWTKEKADHEIGISGTYNEIDDGECGVEQQITSTVTNPITKECDNRKGCHLKYDTQGIFGMSVSNMINITHVINYDGDFAFFVQSFGDCP